MVDDTFRIEINKYNNVLRAYLDVIDKAIKNNHSEISKISEFKTDEKTNYIIVPKRLLTKQAELLVVYISYKDYFSDFDQEKIKNSLFDAAFKVRYPNGDSALHIAVRKYCSNVITSLLEKGGAELCRAVNQDGETPLHLAIRLRYSNSAEAIMMVEKMLPEDLTIADNKKPAPFLEGYTPLELAIKYERDDVVTAIAKKASYNEVKKYRNYKIVGSILEEREKQMIVEALQKEVPQQELKKPHLRIVK